MEHIVRKANREDLESLKDFMGTTEVKLHDLESWIDFCLLASDAESGMLKGTIGIQPFADSGLLRALVLKEGSAEEILFLLQQAIKLAKEKNLGMLYCVVNNKNASNLFYLLGFKEINVEDLPVDVRESSTVNAMKVVNNSKIMYYSISNVDN
ncbi:MULTISPECIES: hypothetical protein [unclassified Niallia]|uniref:hypothetical protein n=1 Tax=unclassified Niallia TaxID=2837522 RepID=UPI001EDA3BE3|nr:MULTISPECIES: hypothetical protein [unclassified Niallia]MDL0437415.1 hypothetical protein [Niallia sp. SS-2023]UPO87472.1 hypothetical protein L8T27_018250 [Niallia sp. Man26]